MSKLRRKFREAAQASKDNKDANEKEDPRKIQKILNKQRRDNSSKIVGEKPEENVNFIEETPYGSRRRRLKRQSLSLSTKIKIVYDVVVKGLKQKEVARENRIGHTFICKLINKAYKNAKFLEELMSYRDTEIGRRVDM